MIDIIFIILIALVIFEFFLQILIRYFRKEFQWLIIEKDNHPNFDQVAFEKFINNSFDKELGWVKKANSIGIEKGKFSNITYHIDDKGSRENFVQSKTSIVTFGDSYTFCKQVEDKQTWQVQLSQKIGDKVLNFGTGNFGVDQAFLYYQRHKIPDTTKIVILGFVPETICRIHSYWKHYLEFGNTFAFKPKFTLESGQLKLHNNLLNGVDDFYKLDNIVELAKKNDYFYKKNFRRLQFRFPYLVSFILHFKRNSSLLFLLIKKKIFSFLNINKSKINNAPFSKIMFENITHSHKMYQDKKSCDLLEAILLKFSDLACERGHKPVFLIMPQLMDLKIINKGKISPYHHFFSEINKKVPVLDITGDLASEDLDSLYSEDIYGGHFSEFGNSLVAEKVSEYLDINHFNRAKEAS